jgi:hypothetical protein
VAGLFLFVNCLTAFFIYGHMRIQPAVPAPNPLGDSNVQQVVADKISADRERDEWKAKYKESEQTRLAAEDERDTLRRQLDDRETNRARKSEITKWFVRIRDFRANIEQDTGPTRQEFNELVFEFHEWSKRQLDESQNALLNSKAGVPFSITSLKGERKMMWHTLELIVFRLDQFIQALD